MSEDLLYEVSDALQEKGYKKFVELLEREGMRYEDVEQLVVDMENWVVEQVTEKLTEYKYEEE